MLDLSCPICKGARVIEGGAGVQVCPYCEGSGRDPGQEFASFYTLNVSLSANQNLPNQRVSIDGSAYFRFKALSGTATGAYSLRIRSNDGRYLMRGGSEGSSDLVFSENLVGSRENPSPFFPAPLYTPNGQILVDFLDRSAAPNVIQLLFWGADVFPSA